MAENVEIQQKKTNENLKKYKMQKSTKTQKMHKKCKKLQISDNEVLEITILTREARKLKFITGLFLEFKWKNR